MPQREIDVGDFDDFQTDDPDAAMADKVSLGFSQGAESWRGNVHLSFKPMSFYRPKALLFEKRSKNFYAAVADYPATEVQEFFGFF